MFQHTAARRRLGFFYETHHNLSRVLTHSRPKAAGLGGAELTEDELVSTHSRPKAAGGTRNSDNRARHCFNTQPPEGGWQQKLKLVIWDKVSTHSRPRRRLATTHGRATARGNGFNTQPPEGGWNPNLLNAANHTISFNTQPPEGGWTTFQTTSRIGHSFNTQPPEGGWLADFCCLVG